MTDQVMTIREMCDAFDVTPRTLRFYEAKELLSPARDGNRRLYSRRDRARLKLILRGKRFGFSLEAIRQFLELYSADGGPQLQYIRVFEAAQERLAELRRQRQELDKTITDLEDQLDWAAKAMAEMNLIKAAE
ncbi:MAG: MerR family DNA-binding transcriptional regulator [Pseudomonadota bacterium]